LVRGGAVQLVLQLVGGPPPLGQQLDQVGRDADGFGGVDQGPLNRLLDPVAWVGGEARVHRRVDAFDGPQQAEVAFFNHMLQTDIDRLESRSSKKPVLSPPANRFATVAIAATVTTGKTG